MASGSGVSFSEEGRHRWKLRWRERTADGAWRARALRVEGTEIARDELMLEIRQALALHGRYEPERSEVLPEEPAELQALFAACIEARRSAGKYTGKTSATYTAYAIRFVERAREVRALGRGARPTVALLGRDLFEEITALDVARGSSTMMGYAPLRFALDAWGWGSDANDEARAGGRRAVWPHLPPAPRLSKDYLPRTPVYGRTIAPTLGHVDAVIRRLWSRPRVDRGTQISALVMRYTGLRSAQVFAIRREDVDLEGRQLFVRSGKTTAEKADARTVPLAGNLVAERGFRAWVESFASGPLFPKRRHSRASADEGRTKQPTETFRQAWEDATAAGEVPRHVWAPPNRRISRPEHSFRAGFQAYLEERRVAGNVIDFLVGHEGETVREVHYGRELLGAAREAVDCIPPVNWVVAEEDEVRGVDEVTQARRVMNGKASG